jgi:hypothetical protein
VVGELDAAARRLDRLLTHSLIGVSGRFHPWGRFYASRRDQGSPQIGGSPGVAAPDGPGDPTN